MEINPPASAPAPRSGIALYAFTIFVSAFLLFQVQPIIAKIILPWFGGTSAVWTICMLFFQLLLLAGYGYAHWLQTLPGRTQAMLHSGLLAASLLLLPIIPADHWKPTVTGSETSLILMLLTATIGAPYFLLSSTSPLLQAWYNRERGEVPYRLFALSNLASMLALLSYPVLIEPVLPTRLQGVSWSVAYALFAVLCAATGWRAAKSAPTHTTHNETATAEPPSLNTRLLWLAFAGCASTLLLTVTNFLTQDVAAIPFLWVLPLAAYLATFIICFDAPRWYNRAVFIPLAAVALGTFLYYLQQGVGIDMKIALAALNLSLFVCCMFCHGELVRLKPHPKFLTSFYLMVSVGGAIGGLFVGLLAPNLFNAFFEFHIGLAVCALLIGFVVVRLALRHPAQAVRLSSVAAVLLVGYYIGKLGVLAKQGVTGYRAVVRNFYGQLRVIDEGKKGADDEWRKLVHGRINHGVQMLHPKYRRSPVAYFCADSGIGKAMRSRPEGKPWNMGILGLGAGALAAYGQAGDSVHLYEINPQVLDLARSEFTYLSDTPAKVNVSLGDGRLSLERDNEQFDILVMDAFSGDSVPVHLITKEAFAMYFRHLKPGGYLAVNISNRYLGLEPVMERAATAFGKQARVYELDPEADDLLCNVSSWVIIMDPAQPPTELLKSGHIIDPHPAFRMWTDDFSNMFSILK